MGAVLGAKGLMSKTKTYNADPIAAKIKALGMQGADLQAGAMKSLGDTGTIAAQETARKEKLARASGEDAVRQAQRTSAQRGLANTSIGLAMESGAKQRAADNIQNIRAQKGAMERGMARENIDIGSGLIQQRGPIRMNKLKVKQKGLLAKLAAPAGAAIGAAFGGPAGAKIGSSLGGAAGEVL